MVGGVLAAAVQQNASSLHGYCTAFVGEMRECELLH